MPYNGKASGHVERCERFNLSAAPAANISTRPTRDISPWRLPYLFRPEPERVVRYQIMFGKTLRFLPIRNGLVPNAAHIILHLATTATLFILLVN
jgi:hypothetical protein